MKTRTRFLMSITVGLAIVALVLFLPRNRQIDISLPATVYRFSSQNHVAECTLTVKGIDTRNRLGGGQFVGTFSLSGFESADESLTATIKFPVSFLESDDFNIHFRQPHGYGSTPDIFYVVVNDDWTEFAALTYDQGDRYAFTSRYGRFIVSGSPDYETAKETAKTLFFNSPYSRIFD